MAYIDQPRRPSAGGMAAVIGVHAALAVALVAGLTVGGVIVPPETEFTGIEFKDPPPPQPPEPTDTTKPADPVEPTIFVPTPELVIKPVEPAFSTSSIIRPVLPDPIPGRGTELVPTPTPSKAFDPVSARPRNDPGGWLDTNDYRTSWIRREMVGTARFRLEIAANGRVEGCRITGSTGHPELDAATCALVSKRARFEPARGSEGQPVPGSYASSVRWVLPD